MEDDLVSRRFLGKFLSPYGVCDMVVDGLEALDAFLLALKTNEPYHLVCLDVMMPKVDGIKVLRYIRDLERQRQIPPERQAKVVMTTALTGTDYVQSAFEIGCQAFASKPIDTGKLLEVLRKLELI